uniref:Thioredoxin domain-containing protein n=1 Tax=Pseudictyota dubia TaxID=2749911 RepID=A0A7R9Z8N9_9STRA|mmetsp:Transcript_29252/g.54224  ORF Transcript_29252/g.54224 Transcript_29252/m.54224 type:complete len:229 (+) Transcript_29252:277-963(+)
MTQLTKSTALSALALFLAIGTASAFGLGVGVKPGVNKRNSCIAKPSIQRNRFAASSPSYEHHCGNPRSKRFYIDHDEFDESRTSMIQNPPPQFSRMRKRKEVVSSVDTLENFETEVLSEKERMVVVRFHAPWCKTCRSIKVAYERLAAANPEIKFVDVSLTNKNPDLRDTMDVKAVPYVHVYHPEAGLVESNGLDRKRLTTFKRVLASYREGKSVLPEEGATKNPYEF